MRWQKVQATANQRQTEKPSTLNTITLWVKKYFSWWDGINGADKQPHRAFFLARLMDVKRSYMKKLEIAGWSVQEITDHALQTRWRWLWESGVFWNCFCTVWIAQFRQNLHSSDMDQIHSLQNLYKKLWLQKEKKKQKLYPTYTFKAHPSLDLCWVWSLTEDLFGK